jgi:hypothetical protein
MGSTTLSKTITGTTPTGVVLRDPANTYGVKRTDLSGPAAVVVAAGTAMTAAGGGVYTKTWADPAPGLTYAWALRITFDNGQVEDLAGTIAGATVNTLDSYLSLADAKALAANLPAAQIAAWVAASDDQRTAALAAATADVDGGRYQGRRFDPTQALEFPRVAYSERSPGSYLGVGVAVVGPNDVVWDWDPATQTALVPDAVKRATLYQADSILSGSRNGRLDAIHDGLASQSLGGGSESYVQGRPPATLCRPAAQLLARYRLQAGRLL